jgi:triosephosphate isomerase
VTPSRRRPLIAGNWKMHKTVAEARTFVHDLCAEPLPQGVDVVVAPPFTALDAVAAALRGNVVTLAAQTMNEHGYGPFTGEISPVMLEEFGVRFVILGHSERRQHCGETDAGINRKVRAALAHGITPIVAVGETKDEYRAGSTRATVTRQARQAFEDVSPADVARCVLAYEPIWAIGTGLSDDPPNANDVMGEIRAAVEGLEAARLLYGGSMKPDNAAALMAQPHIDGGLVGGASLSVAAFAAIIAAAAPASVDAR